ncbi:hypothetical protein cypCar_00044079 [Cyprinus carpio]|nr:hypothetical protein cypCar_00044079 [Cyprinus carpio]
MNLFNQQTVFLNTANVIILANDVLFLAVVVAHTLISGHRGERLDIRCPYKSGYESNPKYFCKGKCNYGYKNIVVKSGSPAKDERFSLTDDKRSRVFIVSITDLRTEDEGQYWCVVKKTLFTTDVYTEILLLVKQGYEKAYKGFYKGNYKDYDVILKSNGGETSVSGRISLRDDGKMRSLTVTIRNLKMEDAGPYICRAGYGYLKQIHLNVIRAPQRPIPVQIFTSTIHPGLVSSSAEGLHLTEKRRKEKSYEKGTELGVVLINTVKVMTVLLQTWFKTCQTETVRHRARYMNVRCCSEETCGSR